jgi:hypothetical protein
MSDTYDGAVVRNLVRAVWACAIVAAVAFILPFAFTRHAAQVIPGMTNESAGWIGMGLLILGWPLAVCAAVLGIVYGIRIFLRRPLHLPTLVPIAGCIAVLVMTSRLFR